MDSKLKKEFFAIDLSKHFRESSRVSTGNIAFDIVTNGGIPGGKLTEISGGPSSWKSLLVLQILAETQKMGGIAVYVDIERSLERGIVDFSGVKLDDLIYPDPNQIVSVEDVFSLLERSVKVAMSENVFLAFGWDSVAATPTKEQLENDIGNNMAAARRAKLIGEGLSKYIPQVFKSNTAFIAVNQLRDKVGVLFGDKEDTPGGRAIKFWASLRMRLRYAGKLKDDVSGEQIGGKGTLKVAKNKVGVPFGEVNFEVKVNQPIGRYEGLLDYFLRHQIVELIDSGRGKKKKFKFVDFKTEFHEDEFINVYEEREKVSKKNE